MALIKMRRESNCCGSEQCSEVAIVIVAVTFSLDDSLLRETCMYRGVECMIPSNAGNQSKFLQLVGFLPPFQMEFSKIVC